MNIYLTFDYELYFGTTGTAANCILQPTDMLLEIAEKHNVKLVQFVDAGYLIKLDEYRSTFPSLEIDYQLIISQLEKLWKDGHDIQLHIHPHWEDCSYSEVGWKMNVSRYMLNNWNDQQIESIVYRYKKKLEEITGPNQIYAFRAGGWCIQPFNRLKSALYSNEIRLDTSVYSNGHYSSKEYDYDFRNAPIKSKWKFNDDPLIEDSNGLFTELPICSIYNSPLFYWKLFLLGRLNPYNHKPLGDGKPVATPGQRKKLLTSFTHNTVSVDGYNAALLNRAFRQQQKANKEEMVIIGHPKSLTRFGLSALEKFIIKHKSTEAFTTFRAQKKSFL